jgi:serine/threonine protein kinase
MSSSGRYYYVPAFPYPTVVRGEVRKATMKLNGGRLKVIELLSSSGGNNYEIIKTLKTSLCGAVFFGIVVQESNGESSMCYIRPEAPTEVAIKTYSKARLAGTLEDPIAEVSALQLLDSHSNIIRSIECIEDADMIYLVMEYSRGGELFDFITTSRPLSEDEAVHMISGIVDGIGHIHKAGLAHRDISMENVILTNDLIGKVIDFGASVYLRRSTADGTVIPIHQRQRGKKNYMAPEVFSNAGPLDPQKADCWSLGVLIFAVMTGRVPFEFASVLDPAFSYVSEYGFRSLAAQWELGLSDQAIDLIDRLLCVDPQERFTIEQVANHPWFHLLTI